MREDPNQLLLFGREPVRAPDELRSAIELGLGEPIELTLTANRTSVLTFRRAKGRVHVRLQRVFLEAPPEVLEAVVHFVKDPVPRARERVLAYFSSRPDAARRSTPDRPPTPVSVRTGGEIHDLAAIFGALNARYFESAIATPITWGEAGHAVRGGHSRGAGRSIRFGAYFRDRDLIRIHPALDSAWVPRFFVESIVFHEMLHVAIPVGRGSDGRRSIHPPEFKERERTFYAYEESRRWERENLRRLLTARG